MTVWLVERHHNGVTQWLGAYCGWTSNALQAIRFSREIDAEGMLAQLLPFGSFGYAGAFTGEHMFE